VRRKGGDNMETFLVACTPSQRDELFDICLQETLRGTHPSYVLTGLVHLFNSCSSDALTRYMDSIANNLFNTDVEHDPYGFQVLLVLLGALQQVHAPRSCSESVFEDLGSILFSENLSEEKLLVTSRFLMSCQNTYHNIEVYYQLLYILESRSLKHFVIKSSIFHMVTKFVSLVDINMLDGILEDLMTIVLKLRYELGLELIKSVFCSIAEFDSNDDLRFVSVFCFCLSFLSRGTAHCLDFTMKKHVYHLLSVTRKFCLIGDLAGLVRLLKTETDFSCLTFLLTVMTHSASVLDAESKSKWMLETASCIQSCQSTKKRHRLFMFLCQLLIGNNCRIDESAQALVDCLNDNEILVIKLLDSLSKSSVKFPSHFSSCISSPWFFCVSHESRPEAFVNNVIDLFEIEECSRTLEEISKVLWSVSRYVPNLEAFPKIQEIFSLVAPNSKTFQYLFRSQTILTKEIDGSLIRTLDMNVLYHLIKDSIRTRQFEKAKSLIEAYSMNSPDRVWNTWMKYCTVTLDVIQAVSHQNHSSEDFLALVEACTVFLKLLSDQCPNFDFSCHLEAWEVLRALFSPGMTFVEFRMLSLENTLKTNVAVNAYPFALLKFRSFVKNIRENLFSQNIDLEVFFVPIQFELISIRAHLQGSRMTLSGKWSKRAVQFLRSVAVTASDGQHFNKLISMNHFQFDLSLSRPKAPLDEITLEYVDVTGRRFTRSVGELNVLSC